MTSRHEKADLAGSAPSDSTFGSKNTSNSTSAQRARLLNWFQTKGSITTLDARRELDVLHPAMRVLELKRSGHRISTVWTKQPTDCGKEHRVGLYVYVGGAA